MQLSEVAKKELNQRSRNQRSCNGRNMRSYKDTAWLPSLQHGDETMDASYVSSFGERCSFAVMTHCIYDSLFNIGPEPCLLRVTSAVSTSAAWPSARRSTRFPHYKHVGAPSWTVHGAHPACMGPSSAPDCNSRLTEAVAALHRNRPLPVQATPVSMQAPLPNGWLLPLPERLA